ncbi:MAG: hypothetical protein A2076_17520 [Geobacteraceae bacterium GWC2_53_11]|nr:MAG: hypothetical protein A2076_17520 [Geobacteraceae bacterium GWC2_53_11]
MAISEQTIEIQRLVKVFESEAAKFHDLQMTLHFVTQNFSGPCQKFSSPNHGIMLWQYYGAIKDETDVELAVTNIEGSDQKWGLRGAELSWFAVIEGEATSLFVRMAKRAGAVFDESETKIAERVGVM